MFRIDEDAIRTRAPWPEAFYDLASQLRSDPRGASLPEDLGEALEVLLASHKALAEAGEEMPSDAQIMVELEGESASADAFRVHALFRPVLARLRQERDEARANTQDPWPFDGETPHQTVARLMREKASVEARLSDLLASRDEAGEAAK